MREDALQSLGRQRVLRATARFPGRIGIERAAVLRAARIAVDRDPKAQLTLRQVESLLAAAEQASGRAGPRLRTRAARQADLARHARLRAAHEPDAAARAAAALELPAADQTRPSRSSSRHREGRVDLRLPAGHGVVASRDARAAGDDRGVESPRVPSAAAAGRCRRTTSAFLDRAAAARASATWNCAGSRALGRPGARPEALARCRAARHGRWRSPIPGPCRRPRSAARR